MAPVLTTTTMTACPEVRWVWMEEEVGWVRGKREGKQHTEGKGAEAGWA